MEGNMVLLDCHKPPQAEDTNLICVIASGLLSFVMQGRRQNVDSSRVKWWFTHKVGRQKNAETKDLGLTLLAAGAKVRVKMKHWMRCCRRGMHMISLK